MKYHNRVPNYNDYNNYVLILTDKQREKKMKLSYIDRDRFKYFNHWSRIGFFHFIYIFSLIFFFWKCRGDSIKENETFHRTELSASLRWKETLFFFATQTHFAFNGVFYDQIDRVAMGSLFASILANLFLGHHEKMLVRQLFIFHRVIIQEIGWWHLPFIQWWTWCYSVFRLYQYQTPQCTFHHGKGNKPKITFICKHYSKWTDCKL